MRRRRCGRALSLVRALTVPTVSLVDAALPHLATSSLDECVLVETVATRLCNKKQYYRRFLELVLRALINRGTSCMSSLFK